MKRTVVNVQTGEQTEIDLTPAEVADALARTAAEKTARDTSQARKDSMTLAEKLAPLGITVAELKAELARP